MSTYDAELKALSALLARQEAALMETRRMIEDIKRKKAQSVLQRIDLPTLSNAAARLGYREIHDEDDDHRLTLIQYLLDNQENRHQQKQPPQRNPAHGFKNIADQFDYVCDEPSVESFANHYNYQLVQFFKNRLAAQGPVKYAFIFKVEFYQSVINEETGVLFTEKQMIHFFSTKHYTAHIILNEHQIQRALNHNYEILEEQIKEFTQRGSGWIMGSIKGLDIQLVVYNPLNGGSHIPLDNHIVKKKACTNIINEDDDCLRWCMKSFIFQATGQTSHHLEKCSTYKDIDISWFNLDGIKSPVEYHMFDKIERQNPKLGFNIFTLHYDENSYDGKPIPEVVPLRICPDRNIDMDFYVKQQEKNLTEDVKDTIDTIVTNARLMIKDFDKLDEVKRNAYIKSQEEYVLSEATKQEDCPVLDDDEVGDSKDDDETPGDAIDFKGLIKKLGKVYREVPVPASERSEPKRIIVNLLLIEDLKSDKKHYVLINNLSRLCSKRTTGHRSKQHYCPSCLNHFNSVDRLKLHWNSGCLNFESVKVRLPIAEDAHVQYNPKNHKKIAEQLRAPFVIYSDFESDLIELEAGVSNTYSYQQHKPNSFGYQMVSAFDKFKFPYKSYHGPNSTRLYLEWLKKDSYEALKLVGAFDKEKVFQAAPMNLTSLQQKQHDEATHCYVCKGELMKPDGIKDSARDHCHITGVFRGSAHNECNLNLNYKNLKIPIIFHNLRGYDGHFIIRELDALTDTFKTPDVKIIAQSSEKYMSFSVNRMKFIDSFNFMTSSLEKLVESMKKTGGPTSFINLMKGFPGITLRQLDLLTRKGVYPYEYKGGDESRWEETSLPPIEAFYSRLRKEGIKKEEYAHAQEVWNEFNCKTFKDYHMLYLKTDVLLLADVFEKFRDLTISYYGLDAVNYISAPSLSMDAALKMSKAQVGLFNDQQIDMLNTTETGIRGGICGLGSTRYAKANVPGTEGYDPNKPTKYIMYWDANNLYGWAMMQYLPIDEFRYENINAYTKEYILKLADDATRGCFILCDLGYPKELHDLHNDYPLAVEKTMGEQSETIKALMEHVNKMNQQKFTVLRSVSEAMNIPVVRKSTVPKLIQNLNDKKGYLTHFRNLKYYLEQGLVLQKVHEVISFRQETWLKDFIEFNTKKRIECSNNKDGVGKDFFKLMNNSVFGKTLENVRGRTDIRMTTSDKAARRMFNKTIYKDHVVLKEDKIITVTMKQVSVYMNKPIFVGFAVLELSKLLMYKFHYGTVKAKYGDKAKLLYTDTDSLIYEIETEDIYEDLQTLKGKFDLSNYKDLKLQSHKAFDDTNNTIPGFFKDESDGHIILEFIALRPKSYAFRVEEKIKKKSKGVPESAQRGLTFENYKEALFSYNPAELVKRVQYNSFRSIDHKVFTQHTTKIGLSGFDDKRWVCNDRVSTLAHGHYKIELMLNFSRVLDDIKKMCC